MSDPLEKVKPGDPPDRLLDATTFNSFIDAAKWVRDRFRGQVGAGDSESVVGYPSVYVHVRVAGAFPPMSVLAPTAAAIDPVEEPAAVQDHPVFDAAAPAAATDTVLVTLAATTEDGDVVKAVAMGVAVCDVNVTDTGHKFAVPITSDSTKLASAASGSVQIVWKESGTGTKRAVVFLTGQASAAATVSSWKEPVRVATTANGTLSTAFENGDTIDGVVLATGNRILIKDQTTATENGIYTVNASGSPTRATDADTGSELLGATMFVSEGTANADTVWACTNNATITVGSTNLAFIRLVPGSLVAEEVDGSPSYSGTGTIRFDQADGFVLTQPAAGIVRVDIADATTSQAGKVNTTAQTFGGEKTFYDQIRVSDTGSPTGFGISCSSNIEVSGALIAGANVSASNFQPGNFTDAGGPTNAIFFSTTQSKLVYKDSGGTVHVLY